VVLRHHSSAAAIAAAAPAGLKLLSSTVSYALEEPAAIALTEVCLTRFTSFHSFTGDGVRMRPSNLACLTGLREVHLSDIIYAGAAPGVVGRRTARG
jgi:hypothetical protein